MSTINLEWHFDGDDARASLHTEQGLLVCYAYADRWSATFYLDASLDLYLSQWGWAPSLDTARDACSVAAEALAAMALTADVEVEVLA